MYKVEYDDKKTIDENKPFFIKECYNVKSLTMDIRDFNNLLYDEPVNDLVYNLYLKTKKVVYHFNDNMSIDKVTIINNNDISCRIIYEIINCEYMINEDESSEVIKEKIKELEVRLDNLKEKYEKEEVVQRKNRIKKDIDFIEYFIDNNLNNSKDRVLKLKE